MEGIDISKLTPAMRQYMEIKHQHPECVLLFRMGDFYETFYKDAEICAKELQITLTARGKGPSKAPLAGIPYHALDTYLPKLVKKGYKVGIVEQLEDPKKAKGIVKRGIVRIVTPGTVLESNILDQKNNNFLMAVFRDSNKYGMAVADVSTGEFFTAELSELQKLHNEIVRFSPAEIILPRSMKDRDVVSSDSFINYCDDYNFQFKNAYKALVTHFDTLSLEGYGIENDTLSVAASGALLSYLNETQRSSAAQITTIKKYSTHEYLVLDNSTVRNLELLRNIMDATPRGSLLEALDTTITPMGARFLRAILLRPLIDVAKITQRHDAVDRFAKDTLLREETRAVLKEIYDLERLVARISHGSANPRDLLALKNSLEQIPRLTAVLKEVDTKLIKQSLTFSDLQPIAALIKSAIKEEAPVQLRNGNIIEDGYSQELDELRKVAHGGKGWVLELEQQERERTGIKALKVGFNRVFGYYIEVSKTNLHLVPENYVRKQTTANGERFITQELKEKESLILGAEEKIQVLEFELFQKLLLQIAESVTHIQHAAQSIARIDCFSALADVAQKNNYVRPAIRTDYITDLKDSRHPVVERMVTDYFVPNDCSMDKNTRVHIITGPNMAGKSTYMRQIALIQLMAQIGSFVPAKEATLGVVDRIFTRVGAYDDLSQGQSTFMVEMHETANILNNATNKSLIILDEIGRGTSTYDGVSIAWAVAEYIHETIGARCLFATHYHQLNKLSKNFKGIANFNIAVKEKDGDIIFLRKILEGGTDKSYGIEVAKLAGVPTEVIEQARTVMHNFEVEDEVGDRLHRNLKRKVTVVEETREPQKEPAAPMTLTGWIQN